MQVLNVHNVLNNSISIQIIVWMEPTISIYYILCGKKETILDKFLQIWTIRTGMPN